MTDKFWDFWMYEDVAGRGVSIYEGRDLDDPADIRDKRYQVDIKIWCWKYFWNAEQAALISFGRDPDKVVHRSQYDRPFLADDEDYKRHNELWDALTFRHDAIKEAQSQKVLPDFFPPAMFVEWAIHKKFCLPDFVKEALHRAEHERHELSLGKKPTIFTGVFVDQDEAPETGAAAAKKNSSQQKRRDNNLLKIILALLLKWEMEKADTSALSDKLARILRDKSLDTADDNLRFGKDTIKIRLEEALDLLE